jgi:ribosome-associated protein
MNHSQSEDAPAPPSKSQRKRESSALQDVGKMLVKLPTERIRKLDLPDALRTAVLEAQRITSHGALRRQMQYIGRLMRDVDAEPIIAQLAAIRGASESTRAEFHALERWRERLLADDAALTDWLAIHPLSDAQQLRQLIRNARREAAESKPPRASRALFRMLAGVKDAGSE